jgi:hypothetical protein
MSDSNLLRTRVEQYTERKQQFCGILHLKSISLNASFEIMYGLDNLPVFFCPVRQ